jgi:seryl-tRNA synthetase
VPYFADPLTKQFYTEYTAHIEKAVLAIRNKDEATFMKLRGEGKKLEKKFQYFMSERKSTSEDIKKKQAWNKKAMPYIQEIIQSDYNQKLEKEEQ